MTDARSTYDESNEIWPYFVLTILGVFLIPMTISQVASLTGTANSKKPRVGAHAEYLANQNKKQRLYDSKLWFVIVGWAVVASLVAFMRKIGNSSAVTAPDVWDPYTILNVARTASVKEIRSAYRKLSLELHPDKVKDIAESTKEQIEAAYVEVSKAYRALTDEVTRENFLQFGHPDGPQPVTHGIALPAFLFNPAASLSFIAVYLLGFGVGIPLVVGKWWASSQLRTRKGLLQDTANQFCELLAKDQPHFITRDRILRNVLLSPDMDDALRSLDPKLVDFDYEKRLEIVYRYLSRKSPQSQVELTVAVESARILMGLHDFSAEFGSFPLCQRALELRRAFLHAIPFDKLHAAELLQLKDANLEIVDETPNPEEIKKVINNARSYLPRLKLLSAKFKVLGESEVTTSSQAHLEIKFIVLPLGDKAPELSDDVIDPKTTSEELDVSFKGLAAINDSQPELPDAVMPYFPEDIQTGWYLYLYGELDNKLQATPLPITRLDLSNLSLSREQVEKGEDVIIGTLVLPSSIVTPPVPQKVPFKVALLSSTYYGADIRTPLVMDIVPAQAPIQTENDPADDDDLDDKSDKSDSDEDDVEGLSDIDTSSEEEDNADDEK